MASSTGCSVLHVDDDVTFGDLTADMLSEQQTQFTVETATSASEGLDRLAVDRYLERLETNGRNGHVSTAHPRWGPLHPVKHARVRASDSIPFAVS